MKSLNLSDYTTKSEIISFTKSVLNSLSKLNIIYKNIIINYGCFSILFFASIIDFEISEPQFDLYLWHKIEVGVLVIFYILFGFILYWKFFTEIINKFLLSIRESILSSKLTHIEANNFALSLPRTPNEIDKFKSDIRNVVIWLITIIIAILITFIVYLQLQ